HPRHRQAHLRHPHLRLRSKIHLPHLRLRSKCRHRHHLHIKCRHLRPPPRVPATPISPPPLRLPPPETNPRSPHDAIIIAVFASLGGLLLLAFFAAAVTCSIRKRKKKMAAKRQAVDVEDHVDVHEATVQGPHRQQPAAPTSIDDDIEIHELMEEGEVVGETSRREPAGDATFERRGRRR
ncbi:unnamed protein product, partial [Musa hybrid cultivar]